MLTIVETGSDIFRNCVLPLQFFYKSKIILKQSLSKNISHTFSKLCFMSVERNRNKEKILKKKEKEI
jgi:hypothetical protein